MLLKQRFRPLLALLLCGALLCAGPISPVGVYASVDELNDMDEGYEDAYADDSYEEDVNEPTNDYSANSQIAKLQQQIEENNRKLEEYQAQQKELQNKIKNAQGLKEDAVEVRNHYGSLISSAENELATLHQLILDREERIALLEEDIVNKQAEIEEKQGEYDVQYETFKKRLRIKYMQDDGTVLGLLLGTDSFADFLTRVEYMTRVGQYDRDLMATLTAERLEMERIKAALEEDKDAVETDKAGIEDEKAATEDKRQELGVYYSKAAKDVHDYDAMEQQFNANLEANKEMQKKMKEEIDRLYREIEFSKNPYAGGPMAWPLPGYSTISSKYGLRFGGSDFHTGTDITGSGCMGKPVVAANDGVVAFVNYGSSGYGNYIILDHGVGDNGKTVSTLYAHLSGISVSLGQTVGRGETIGQCGSTGWSTGPHLHFEVRIGGKEVDSYPYIAG